MSEKLDVVIAGGGRVGFQTAEILNDRGHDVLVIEPDESVCEQIADGRVATVIEGDATDPDILDQAALERRDVLAALTGETGTNLAVCMEAEHLVGDDIWTVARIDRGAGRRYTEFVDEVVFPERAGAKVAANRIVGADVQVLADVTDTLDIMQVRVAEGAPAAGRALSDVRLPRGSLVVSAAEGERIAGPETELMPGKTYVVAVEPDVVDEVMNLLRG